jgi:hypothetical protein
LLNLTGFFSIVFDFGVVAVADMVAGVPESALTKGDGVYVAVYVQLGSSRVESLS